MGLRRTGAITGLIAAIPRFLGLLFRLLGDSRVPAADKAILAAALAYTLSPIDLVPDIIPWSGLLDDIYFVALAIDRLVKRTDPNVVREHWTGSEATLRALTANLDRVARRLPAWVRRKLETRVEPVDTPERRSVSSDMDG